MPLPPLPNRVPLTAAPGFSTGDILFDRFVLLSEAPTADCRRRWLATDITTRAGVALEFYPPLSAAVPGALERLQRAALVASQVQHPRLVRLLDLRAAADYTAAAWELADGPTWAQSLATQPGFAQVASWAMQLAEALDYAHLQLGVAHGALKPSRIVLTPQLGIRVTHFHVVDVLRDLVLQAGGTWDSADELPYLSPQRWGRAPVAPSDDCYAFGAMLYALLAGSPPFFEGDLATQAATSNVPPIFLRRLMAGLPEGGIPMPWEVAITSCLAKRPEDRPTALTGFLATAAMAPAVGAALNGNKPTPPAADLAPRLPSLSPSAPAAVAPPAAPPTTSLPPMPAPVAPSIEKKPEPPPAPVPAPEPVATTPAPIAEPAPVAEDIPEPAPAPGIAARVSVETPAPAPAPAPAPVAHSAPPPPAPATPARAQPAESEHVVDSAYPLYGQRPHRRSKGLYWTVVFVCAAALGFGAWWWWRDYSAAQQRRDAAVVKLNEANEAVSQRDFAKAVPLLREAASLDPENPVVKAQLRTAETTLAQQQEVKALLEELERIKGDPQHEARAMEAVARVLVLEPFNKAASVIAADLESARYSRLLKKELASKPAAPPVADPKPAPAVVEPVVPPPAPAGPSKEALEAEAAKRRVLLLELKMTAMRLDTPAQREAARGAIEQLRKLSSDDPELAGLETRLRDAERPPPPPAPAVVATPPPATTPPVAPTPAPQSVFVKAKLLSSAEPIYPRELLRSQRSGDAEVSFTVNERGAVTDVEVVRATDAAFGRAAAEAVRKFRFAPATRDGTPVTSRLSVPFEFKP